MSRRVAVRAAASAAVIAVALLWAVLPADRGRLAPGPTWALPIASASGQIIAVTAEYAPVSNLEALTDPGDLVSLGGGGEAPSWAQVRAAASAAAMGVTGRPAARLPADPGWVGDSAGLALALAAVDQSWPDRLLDGRVVAATGAIGPGGRVGSVGALDMKALAAVRAGASLLLVPVGQGEAARVAAPALPVVEVSTLREAVDALCSASCPAALTRPRAT